jgi:hypothetical protein
MDGDLDAAASRAVSAHLAGCLACSERLRGLRAAVEMLAETPRLESPEPIAPRVFDRLEVETRGAGLALVLRPTWKARPLIFPSLLPAAAVLSVVLGIAFALDRDPVPLPAVATPGAESWGPTAASGTESNPLFPSTEVSAPRLRNAAAITVDLLEGLGDSPMFIELVVARDGTVSNVTLLEGDSRMAAPLLEALRRERFEPGRRHGRAVAVSLYRLISRLDVFS